VGRCRPPWTYTPRVGHTDHATRQNRCDMGIYTHIPSDLTRTAAATGPPRGAQMSNFYTLVPDHSKVLFPDRKRAFDLQ